MGKRMNGWLTSASCLAAPLCCVFAPRCGQNPEKACDKSNGVHGLIGAQGRGAGLASTLHFVSGHLSEAYRTKKPFVFGGRMNYAGTKFCKEKDMYAVCLSHSPLSLFFPPSLSAKDVN